MRGKKPAGKTKRVWITPKLTVIDIRQTASGKTAGPPEGDSIIWQPAIS
jgi:hypothetical protein